MMGSLNGKKLLVLGGSYQHRKIVQSAQSLGVLTLVTDYLDIQDSPAKQMADVPLNCNIFDIDGLAEICRTYHVDGIAGPYLDPVQMPYQELCARMGFHCFGNHEQFRILTDKQRFKEFCVAHGADIIPTYAEEEIISDKRDISWPVLVKPSDSRGSRGQRICFSREDALSGIEAAKSESKSGTTIIEKYMGNENDVQLVYLVSDGEPLLYKIEDRYTGKSTFDLENLCIATLTPSKHKDVFMNKADAKVRNMIRALGLKNAPVFIQAFIEGDKALLYDPGLRMPGDDYDCGYKAVVGIDIAEMFIRFAVTGKFFVDDEAVKSIQPCDEKCIAMILPCLKPGKIAAIYGLQEIAEWPEIVSFSISHKEGSTIEAWNDVRQRFGEFVIVCDDVEGLKRITHKMFELLKVISVSGEDMLIEKFGGSK